MKQASALFRLLGDEARLRLLRLLARDRFNVTELTGILGLAQSGVSRHLGLLKDAGLVAEERDGAFAYYRLAPAVRDEGAGGLWPLLESQFETARDTAALKADEARLQEVLRLRRENFDAHAGPDTRDGRQLVPGRSWAAWARALGHLLPRLDVVDIGCGEGYLTIEVARWARQVVAVDRSPAVLARARALATRRHATNIVFKRGEMERLPVDDHAADVALLSQALHHAAHPAAVVAEASRVLRPGGRLLVLDLGRHDEAWVREKLGDRHLGFAADELDALLKSAGLQDVRVGVGARRAGDPFAVLVASGTADARRPATVGAARSRKTGPAAVLRPRRRKRSRLAEAAQRDA
jgi:ArsR family transcriptional regulator